MYRNVLSMYTTYVVSIATLRYKYGSMLENLSSSYMLKPDQYEYLFDWLIQQAFIDLATNSSFRLQQHYRHEVYEDIYETHFKYTMSSYLLDRLKDIQVPPPNTHNTIYKLMVCGDVLFISRGM